MKLEKSEIERIITCAPDAIEPVLKLMKERIEVWKERGLDYIVERTSPKVSHGGTRSEIKAGSRMSPRTQKFGMNEVRSQVSAELLAEKDDIIRELKDTVEILELKIKKMEQLLHLKDEKIQTLSAKLVEADIPV
eukprot:TRINITY_DN14595_c0_g1_i4.p2 TRINITY_DN14595_c0_g1~~TRINITY_DN14595_c0_g1_i4.p2  ORF type:complete len:135 (+),score=54.41 TRINITY_DN14595_c0_g1_i4:688-1092(+)